MLNVCISQTESLIIYSSPPIRDLDWLDGAKQHLNWEYKRRAALGQRSGTAALPGQECLHCATGTVGPFEFVLFTRQYIPGSLCFLVHV